MDICLLSKMYPPIKGGSGMYAYEIANALGKRGHDIDVFTQSTGSETDLQIHENVSVERICKARRYLVTFETLNYSLQARRAVDFDDYDIVHGTLMPASTIALPRIDTPVVLTSHSFAPCEVRSHSAERLPDYLLKYIFHPMNALFDVCSSHRADHVIAISSQMQRQLVETYRLDSDDVTLVSHGVDTETYYPRGEQHPAVSPDKTSVLFVGRLVTRKGGDTAIKALAEASSEEIELLIAGEGRDAERLKELARELNVEDRTQFLGYVSGEELPNLYSSADIHLFASDYEGFGLVILEAMACGTPVVGTEVGAIPDLVNDGENGCVVSHDPAEIGRRIEYLHEHPSKLEQLSEAAFETASARPWTRVAEQVEDVYRSIL